jgi:hypothetical protein
MAPHQLQLSNICTYGSGLGIKGWFMRVRMEIGNLFFKMFRV